MVTAEQLRKLYYAEPFVPFSFILDNGKKVRIKAPEHFMFSEAARKIAFPEDGGIVGFAAFDRVTVESSRAGSAPRRRRKAS